MVQVIQLRCQFHGFFTVICQQTTDTDTHILQPAGGIQTRSYRKGQVGCHQVAEIPFTQSQ